MEIPKETSSVKFESTTVMEQPHGKVFLRDQHSTFAQLKWGAIKDSLYFIAGVRVDNYSDFGMQFTPRGGVIYQPSKNSSVKALYGRSFRAPVGEEIRGIYNYKVGNSDIKPETIDIFELIYIYKIKDLKFSTNIFYSLWKNGIIPVKNVDPDTLEFPYKSINEGENSSIGGEISFFYSLKPFALNFGMTYSKSRALDVTDPDTGEKSDQDYVSFPKYIINAGIHYIFEPADIAFFLNNNIYLKMKEAPISQKSDPEDLPSYYRMDLDISKIIAKKMEISLNIQNLLNRKNYVPSTMGQDMGYPEPGISFLLRVNYKF